MESGRRMQCSLLLQLFEKIRWGFLQPSKEFNAPKTTSRRYFYDQNKKTKNGRKRIGRTPDLPQVLEKQLANHLLQTEARFYGLTLADLKEHVFEIAKQMHSLFLSIKKKNLQEVNG